MLNRANIKASVFMVLYGIGLTHSMTPLVRLTGKLLGHARKGFEKPKTQNTKNLTKLRFRVYRVPIQT